MSRATGRRAIARTTSRRSAVLGVVIVGLVLAMLTLAGTTPLGIGRPVDDPSRVSLDQRTFSCSGGIASAVTVSGNLRDGLLASQPIGAAPVTVVADRDVARGSFAAQQATSGKSFAWVPCPEARARWWFLGAGGAAVTHDTVLTLTNPRTGPAVVDIDVYGPEGLVDSPGLKGITIGGGTVRTFDLARTAPAVGNLAVNVTASRGLVAVSAADKFAPGSIGKTVEEWLPSQSLPARAVTLAGMVADPGSATVLVANPGQVDAIVKVEVIGTTGTFEAKSLPPFTVGPQSVATVPASGIFDGTPVALRVTSEQPVTATVRSLRRGDIALATGVRPIRGSTTFAVPTGTGQLVLSSLASGARMQVVAYDARGQQLSASTVKVPATSSVGVPLTAKIRYVRLVAGRPDVVAGFAIAGTRGIVSAGVLPTIRSLRLPQVRPGW
ncbi:MAG: DUF5719 family protein [Marmoricola sp.]